MSRAKSFFLTTLLGGLVVILPVTLIFILFSWLYAAVTDFIGPLTRLILERTPLQKFAADLIVLAVIVAFCFAVGLMVKTSVGRFIQEQLESKVLKIAPGYTMVKETVLLFLGRKKSPFSAVALVNLYQSDTMATAFVTDEHEDGSFTVFVPTGPNPTSGQIFHLPRASVHRIDVGIEETMRSIIACGAGSAKLLSAYHRKSH